MNAPQCARCGATSADRTYIAFTGNTAECYCLYCLDEHELGMALGLIKDQGETSQPPGGRDPGH